MKKQSLKEDQQGLVAIVVTVLIMLILTLIVMGFIRNSRREQRQALDRQLSTQAFYAAEAGINDAIEALRLGGLDGQSEKTTCDPIPKAGGGSYNNVLNTVGPISYTCVLVNPSPRVSQFDAIGQDESEVTLVQSRTGVVINEINFYWQDNAGTNNFSGCNNIQASGIPTSWPATCNAGILRIDALPYRTDLNPSRDTLLSSQSTAFLYPLNGGAGTLAYSSVDTLSEQGAMAAGNCTATATSPKLRLCSLTLTGLSAANSSRYYVRMKTLFGTSAVSITAEDSAGTILEQSGNQALIDATGKANDVLRRIQVSVPLTDLSGPFPEFASQTTATLCKRFSVTNTIGIGSAPATAGGSCDPRQAP